MLVTILTWVSLYSLIVQLCFIRYRFDLLLESTITLINIFYIITK